MDTNSRAQTDAGDRSGGKILCRRQKFVAKTPYDRPPPPQPAGETDSGSNWFRGLGLPSASRMIFSGATKLLSFMTDADSSSSSSESEDDGSCDDIGDDNIPTEIGNLKEKDDITSEMIESFRKQSQPSLLKSDPKWVIEQLIVQVTFSREECDKLIEIIKSRVVDCSATEEGQITGIFETPSKIFGSDGQDLCSKALLEAKNWLDEKKVGSSAKADLDHGVSGFSSIELRHLTKCNVGSPVDMAKSYMLARPPWASPSLRRSGSKTPSPMAIDLFKEETPFSAGGNSLSSSQKRDTFASGSWNIQDEIRRVRSKATEDLLCSLPSTRIDLSSYALEPKTLGHSSVADKIDADVDRMHMSHSLTPTQLVDASVNLAAGLNTRKDFPGSSALGLAENNLEIELLSSDQPTIGSEPNQDPESNLKFEGGRVTTNSHDIIIGQELLSLQHDAYDESGQRSISTKEVAKVSGPTNANGSASPRSTSLSAGQDIEHPKKSDENNLRPVNSVNDKLTSSVPGEEMCGFLSETLVEIPLENEVKSIVAGSQDSSSTHLKDSTQVDLKHGVIRGKTGSGDEKQPDKKATKYQRKGRGRGK